MDLSLRATVGREHRRFVSVSIVEAREDTDGGLTLDGYASVFDTPYTVRDWMGDFEEVVRHGAFTRTLSQRDDVRLLINHEGLPLARTKSGTLTLAEDDHGLHVVSRLEPSDPDVAVLAPKMLRGDLDQMSFAFEVTPSGQTWSPDYLQRDITEVKLWDVSVVTYPASEATSVGLRDWGVDPGRLAAIAAEIRAGKVLSAANEQMLREARDGIDTVLQSATPAEETNGLDIETARRLLVAL